MGKIRQFNLQFTVYKYFLRKIVGIHFVDEFLSILVNNKYF